MGEVIKLDNPNIIDDRVYQFQEYMDRYVLLEVGLMKNDSCDILINEFKADDTPCLLVSCVYNKNNLAKFNDTCCIPLFKIIRKDKSTLSYNFHTFEHKKNNTHITTLVSDRETKILLRGFFSYKEDDRIIYKNNVFEGRNAIEKLIELIVKLED